MNGSTITAYDISDEQLARFAQWTDGERLQWVRDTANFILSLQTREERIAAYRAKEGKNLRYYNTYGWPETFLSRCSYVTLRKATIMTMTRICEVRNNQLIIPMPESYEHKTVRVVIEDEAPQESYEEEMKCAMQDPRFLADMREVMEDFNYLDGHDIHE